MKKTSAKAKPSAKSTKAEAKPDKRAKSQKRDSSVNKVDKKQVQKPLEMKQTTQVKTEKAKTISSSKKDKNSATEKNSKLDESKGEYAKSLQSSAAKNKESEDPLEAILSHTSLVNDALDLEQPVEDTKEEQAKAQGDPEPEDENDQVNISPQKVGEVNDGQAPTLHHIS